MERAAHQATKPNGLIPQDPTVCQAKPTTNTHVPHHPDPKTQEVVLTDASDTFHQLIDVPLMSNACRDTHGHEPDTMNNHQHLSAQAATSSLERRSSSRTFRSAHLFTPSSQPPPPPS